MERQSAQTVRKTYKYKLKPTREQTRLLERTLMLCRHIYNAAMGERREAWRMRDLSVGYYHQTVELPGLKEALPEYGAVHSQVLQDVVLRVDCALQAFFRRVQPGRNRDSWLSSLSWTRPLSPLYLSPSRRTWWGVARQWLPGALHDWPHCGPLEPTAGADRWSRPLEGTPKTVTLSREADGWYVCVSCAEVPMQPLLPTGGQETGIDLGLESFATFATFATLAAGPLAR